MNKARGGVLFIDEAYGLKPTTNSYANECLLALLANLTDPKYVGNMLVIIAGYSNDIRILMDSNPGMTRWAPKFSNLNKIFNKRFNVFL